MTSHEFFLFLWCLSTSAPPHLSYSFSLGSNSAALASPVCMCLEVGRQKLNPVLLTPCVACGIRVFSISRVCMRLSDRQDEYCSKLASEWLITAARNRHVLPFLSCGISSLITLYWHQQEWSSYYWFVISTIGEYWYLPIYWIYLWLSLVSVLFRGVGLVGTISLFHPWQLYSFLFRWKADPCSWYLLTLSCPSDRRCWTVSVAFQHVSRERTSGWGCHYWAKGSEFCPKCEANKFVCVAGLPPSPLCQSLS